MAEERGEAPRPDRHPLCHPSPPSGPVPKPGSPLYAGLSAINKYKVGVDVLPENVLFAVAGAIACAAEAEARSVTLRVEAVEKEHLGHYGFWRVRILDDLEPQATRLPSVLMDRSTIASWHGPVDVETMVVKHGLRDYEVGVRVRLTNGPNKLWRALLLASRVLFLLGLREADGIRGLI